MIDPTLFTVDRLLAAFLVDESGNRDRWRQNAEIVRNYAPSTNTRPKNYVVRYTHDDGVCFLRFSRGPRQGHFWDVYGDDYQTSELALIALLEAPVPPRALVKSVWGPQLPGRQP